MDSSGAFLNNKCFFLPSADGSLLSLLNSTCVWFQLFTMARAKRGGYIEAEAQYVDQLRLPETTKKARSLLAKAGASAGEAAVDRLAIQRAVRRRIVDLARPAAAS